MAAAHPAAAMSSAMLFTRRALRKAGAHGAGFAQILQTAAARPHAGSPRKETHDV